MVRPISLVFRITGPIGSDVIEMTWLTPAALSCAACLSMSAIWVQHGWQVRPSWKNSSTVLPRYCDRLTGVPVLAARVKAGAA